MKPKRIWQLIPPMQREEILKRYYEYINAGAMAPPQHYCGGVMVPYSGDMKCMGCDAVFTPGIDFIERLRKNFE